MQNEVESYGIDLVTAAKACIGQMPINLVSTGIGPVSAIKIGENYGRFGNNFYQVVNAFIIAKRLGCATLILPPAGPDVNLKMEKTSSVRLKSGSFCMPANATYLEGGFYAPFGFEGVFLDISDDELFFAIRHLGSALYNEYTEVCPIAPVLAFHFRGGDIFQAATAHAWYTQPPAAYYIMAFKHAVKQRAYEDIVLVSEDTSNPALQAVMDFLRESKIQYRFLTQSMNADIKELCSAQCIISSNSTFSEVSAMLSLNLRQYYSFRRHGSQDVFSPFVQSRVADALFANGVSHHLVDDITFSYTYDKSWKASDEQVAAIVTFLEHNLRIYSKNNISIKDRA